MRDYGSETKSRVAFIRAVLEAAGAGGIVYGNSGGKDSALAGILCKLACDDTVGLIMPCGSKRNYEADKADAEAVSRQFAIAVRVVDLSDVKNGLVRVLDGITRYNDAALANLAPRLRMSTLYAVAASENRLVAGTGNRSERYMGYFTKWGDGAFDFNPIADLTVTEVYEFLRYLDAPEPILSKAPSAGLFDGQTDEQDMGVAYRSIDEFLLTGVVNGHDRAVMEKFHKASEHKRKMPAVFGG
ncbi:MAG: NAD(+) synthase [Desulfovibrionaceae bacterium]|nr:NAD(+) synthase [Desulfovibrionaceae bacterium]